MKMPPLSMTWVEEEESLVPLLFPSPEQVNSHSVKLALDPPSTTTICALLALPEEEETVIESVE